MTINELIYGTLAVVSAFFAACCFIGFVISLCAWDVIGAGAIAIPGSVLIYLASVFAIKMEE